MKKIIMTGGGSAGHVMPNIALIEKLRDEGYEIHYIGTKSGIERELVEKYDYVTYHPISSGKLRRYFSLKNLTDPFRVLKGISQSRRIVKDVEPNVVFSKGGFVSVPVVMAAKGKAPIIVHECDFTPGLANRIGAKYADRICVSFEDTLSCVGSKGIYTGSPVRRELTDGNAAKGRRFLGFSSDKPILLSMGGSLGAAAINDALRSSLDELTKRFNVVHICGKGKVDGSIDIDGYKQFEFIGDELGDVFACTSLMISRAGANAVFEILALNMPSILIPLPKAASRGDQLLNAAYFEKRGYSLVLDQDALTRESLIRAVNELDSKHDSLKKAMAADNGANAAERVMNVIRSYTR